MGTLGMLPKWQISTPKPVARHTRKLQRESRPTTRSQTEFHYGPIPDVPPSFRLFTIFPGGGNEVVQGTLDIHRIVRGSSEPGSILDWDALSYCWAAPNRSETIIVNSQRLKITKNLHSALLHLRDTRECITLWIDQICINQDDMEERNRQVRQMGRIYREARKVIAWLGHGPGPEDAVFQCLSKVDDAGDEGVGIESMLYTGFTGPYLSCVGSLLRNTFDPRAPNSRGSSYRIVSPKAYAIMEAVMKNTWFRRVWLVQEATISSKLILQHGLQIVSLRALYAAILCVDNTYRFGPSGDLYPIERIVNLRERCLSFQKDMKLSDLLRMSRHCEASDDRDKIYGLLGIVRAKRHIKGHPNPESEYGILADYSKRAEQLFLEVAMFLISEEQSLSALRYCCAETSTAKYRLPTWVQDWSDTDLDCCRNFDLRDDKLDDSMMKYTAALGRKPRPRFFLNEKAMVLTGILFDTVQETTVLTHTLDSIRRLNSETWAEWRAFALKQSQPDPYYNQSNRESAWWRLSVGPQFTFIDRKGTSTSVRDKRRRWLEGEDRRCRWFEGKDRTRVTGDKTDSYFRSRYALLDMWQDAREKALDQKVLFRAAKGYLGRSCHHVRPGDKVCVLWGGRLPFILRESGHIRIPHRVRTGLSSDFDEEEDEGKTEIQEESSDNNTATLMAAYKLIGGESYIHGLAQGEAVTMCETDGIEAREFCII